MNVTVYGLPHCSTCQKALAYLDELGVTVDAFHDVKTSRLSAEQVDALIAAVGGVGVLFSKRAMKYRQMGLHELELSDAQLRQHIIDEYTFIKRPVVIGDRVGLAGFSKKRYDAAFAG